MLIDERRELKAVDRGETDDTRSREFPTGGERGRGQTKWESGMMIRIGMRGVQRENRGMGKMGGGRSGCSLGCDRVWIGKLGGDE